MTSSGEHAIVGFVENDALERARERISEAAEGKAKPADVEAALDRARAQVEALAATAAALESTLPDRVGEAVRRVNARTAGTTTLRSYDQVAQFFNGLQLMEPGLVQVQRWRPGLAAPDNGEPVNNVADEMQRLHSAPGTDAAAAGLPSR